MKKAILQRFLESEVTFGKLLIEGINHPDIYTIERKWDNNSHGTSCIPQGLYNVRGYVPNNPTLCHNIWEVLNVPYRQNILIHNGNFASEVKLASGLHGPDTDGCILVGLGIEENVPMITRSKEAIELLNKLLGTEPFSLEVKNG